MKSEKKTGADRSQPSVTDEWWDDDRVRSFLRQQSPEDESPDFHVLLRAYRGMVPDAFSRFVRFYVEDGRDINVRSRHGETILDIVSQHVNSAEYAEILREHGAEQTQS